MRNVQKFEKLTEKNMYISLGTIIWHVWKNRTNKPQCKFIFKLESFVYKNFLLEKVTSEPMNVERKEWRKEI
jgi:hypothetical protein